MACFRPVRAHLCANGELVFVDNLRRYNVVKDVDLPCGRCIGCLSQRAQHWGERGMHEAKLHKLNCAPTLTFNDDNVPYRGMIDKVPIQKALRSLRDRGAKFRYMVGHEYGELNGRPHAHAVLFGWQPDDLKYWRKSDSGAKLFRSQWFEENIWKLGHVEIGEVSMETVQYIAKYCMKKVYGDLAEAHYRRQDPETGEIYQLPPESMDVSKRPAIGRTWFEQFGASDVMPWDHVIVNGKEQKPPRYYDKLAKLLNPERFEETQWERERDAMGRSADNTNERLAVREEVARANATRFKRSM